MIDTWNNLPIVNKCRVWNNSMCFYTDSVVVENPSGSYEGHSCGIDYFDCHKIEVNKEAKERYDAQCIKDRIKAEGERQEREKMEFRHHGENTAFDIVCFLDTLQNDKVRQNAIRKLLSVKNFRSDFRRSLRDQVISWLNTPVSERKYPFPLSFRQMGCLMRYSR